MNSIILKPITVSWELFSTLLSCSPRNSASAAPGFLQPDGISVSLSIHTNVILWRYQTASIVCSFQDN